MTLLMELLTRKT